MGFFNEKLVDGLLGRGYYCSKCGAKMFFEDEFEDTLICPACGHDIPLERYGAESDEEYNALYPTKEEALGYEEDDEDDNEYGETYDEVCDELSHDD